MLKRFKRALAAWTASDSADPSDCEKTLAQARLELEAKEKELQRLRQECKHQQRQAGEEANRSIEAAVSKLIQQLANPLSQLAALRHRVDQGGEVRVEDVIKLAGGIERALKQHGLEIIGEVGQQTNFDPSLHQRMSGGDVSNGVPIRVRFPGYQYQGKIALKAMVTRTPEES